MKKRTITYFLLLAAVIFIGQYLTFRVRENQELSKLQAEERLMITNGASELTDWISQAFQVLKYLTMENEVINFIDTGNSQDQAKVAQMFFQISSSTADYDQIRLLSMTGMETVRVDYQGGSPVVIPSEELQDKSDRYYYNDCRQLSLDEYYISPMDLNVEDGEVEIPYKPVIRVCTPVTGLNGYKEGLLVLNYLASNPLDKLYEFSENLMLLNSEGYWLHSPNPDDEWGFMFGKAENMATRYPNEWRSILAESSGQFITDNGLWVFSTIDPISDALAGNPHLFPASNLDDALQSEEAQYFWKIVSHIPPETLNGIRKDLINPIFLSSLVLYPMAFFGIWNLNRRVELEEQTDKHIRFMATHDMMTGLFNRAFFESEIERMTSSRMYPVSIFILDANNLKEINDSKGHLEGDKVIKSIASVLKNSFRTEDIIARVGGDEFAVLLPQTDQSNSQIILQRLQKNINTFNRRETDVQVDVSIGMATSVDLEDLENVLRRADEAMYAMKLSLKEKAKNQGL